MTSGLRRFRGRPTPTPRWVGWGLAAMAGLLVLAAVVVLFLALLIATSGGARGG